MQAPGVERLTRGISENMTISCNHYLNKGLSCTWGAAHQAGLLEQRALQRTGLSVLLMSLFIWPCGPRCAGDPNAPFSHAHQPELAPTACLLGMEVCIRMFDVMWPRVTSFPGICIFTRSPGKHTRWDLQHSMYRPGEVTTSVVPGHAPLTCFACILGVRASWAPSSRAWS